ncbi:hypothetical protein [Pseudodesulfovibrio indicus]|nr:hypothetical protein [Pseudodesulfovibrio indicus]
MQRKLQKKQDGTDFDDDGDEAEDDEAEDDEAGDGGPKDGEERS